MKLSDLTTVSPQKPGSELRLFFSQVPFIVLYHKLVFLLGHQFLGEKGHASSMDSQRQPCNRCNRRGSTELFLKQGLLAIISQVVTELYSKWNTWIQPESWTCLMISLCVWACLFYMQGMWRQHNSEELKECLWLRIKSSWFLF